MSELQNLLESVRGAAGPDRELDVALEVLFPFGRSISHSHRPSSVRGKVTCRYNSGISGTYGVSRYTAYIDAALALVERVLPEHDYILGHTNGGLTIHCQLGPNEMEFGATAPLAILAALLSALISKEAQS